MRDGATDAGALQRAEDLGEGGQVGRVGDGSQLAGDGRQGGFLDGVGVEEARVEVTDLLRIGADRRFRRRSLLDYLPDIFLGLVVQRAESAVHGAVGGDGVLVQPLAVDVDEQVVLCARALVAVAEVDA